MTKRNFIWSNIFGRGDFGRVGFVCRFGFLWSLFFLVSTVGWGRNGDLDFSILREMVVQEGGRKKAFYTFAYEQVLGMTGRTELVVDGRKLPAEELVLRMWLGDRDWEKVPMILVDDVNLRMGCGLERKRKLYSYEELVGNAALVRKIGEAA
ncbi:MAG: hypothetical protein NZL93_05095, partial [Chthoniobacterales bacterium]|nr:hypothetical protein [Chthoniobacterales bacterium]